MPTRNRIGSTSRSTGHKDDGTQLRRLRRACLGISGAIEKVSHGEPTFFTPKRVFAMFADNHHGDGHIAAWLPAADGVQRALIEEEPEIYFPTAVRRFGRMDRRRAVEDRRCSARVARPGSVQSDGGEGS